MRRTIFFFFFDAPEWKVRSYTVEIQAQALGAGRVAQIMERRLNVRMNQSISARHFFAVRLGHGLNIAVSDHSIEIEQTFGIGAHAGAEPLMHLARDILLSLDLKKVERLRAITRFAIPVKNPVKTMEDGLLRSAISNQPGHKLKKVRLGLEYEVDDSVLELTMTSMRSTSSVKGPHLSVSAAFIFRNLEESEVLLILNDNDRYLRGGTEVVTSILREAGSM